MSGHPSQRVFQIYQIMPDDFGDFRTTGTDDSKEASGARKLFEERNNQMFDRKIIPTRM